MKKNESFIYLHRYFYNIEKDTFLSKQKISIFCVIFFQGVVFMDIMILRYSDRWCGFAYFFYLIGFFLWNRRKCIYIFRKNIVYWMVSVVYMVIFGMRAVYHSMVRVAKGCIKHLSTKKGDFSTNKINK